MKGWFAWRWKVGWFRRVAPWIARRTPSCAEISRWSSVTLDRRLTMRETLLRWVHFLICDWCQRYAAQLHFLRQASARLKNDPEASPAHRLSEDARDRLKRRLAGEPPPGRPTDRAS